MRLVCTPPVAAGCGLAALAAVEVEDAATAEARVNEMLHDSTVGMILLEERLYDALSEALRARLARHPVPLVVPFPSPSWVPRREAAELYIVELLRRAIGYRVKMT